MDILNKYGSQAGIGLVSAGLICLVLAFFIFPQITTVSVWMEGQEQPVIITPDSRIAANWLLAAGIRIFPGDSLSYSGIEVPPAFSVPDGGDLSIKFRPGFQINLLKDGIDLQVFLVSGDDRRSALGTGDHFKGRR
jgi:hypothetical protein